MNCTVCGSGNTKLKFLKNGYKILHCEDCGHLFTDFKSNTQEVEKIYSDDYFFKGGAGYDDYTLERDMLIKRGEYYAEKLRAFMESGSLLDVGAAAGFILKGFLNRNWKGMGVEPNRSMVKFGKDNLKLNIEEGTIETIGIDEKFDLVTMIQVVAHIFDIHGSIEKINALLKPGGHVLIETWNKDSLTAKMFGSNWHEYCPPGTLNYFSKETLNNLMHRHGFERIALGRPKKSIHSKHAKSLIRHKLSESKALKWSAPLISLIPGNLILPYPSEDLFWALFRKKQINLKHKNG